MDAMIVVDMQAGLLDGGRKHDLPGVIDHINALTAMVRRQGGRVIWIRHCGRPGDGFAPGTPGWEFLPALIREQGDTVVEKILNDPFTGTPLRQTLEQLAPDRVLVAGWATDFCVDATIRSAVSHGHHVVVVGDGHTLSDRPHLDAPTVMRHHHFVWSGLITSRSIRIATTRQLLDERAPNG